MILKNVWKRSKIIMLTVKNVGQHRSNIAVLSKYICLFQYMLLASHKSQASPFTEPVKCDVIRLLPMGLHYKSYRHIWASQEREVSWHASAQLDKRQNKKKNSKHNSLMWAQMSFHKPLTLLCSTASPCGLLTLLDNTLIFTTSDLTTFDSQSLCEDRVLVNV